MLREFASDHWREKYLQPLVKIFPSFGMTEPEVASSDLNFKLLLFWIKGCGRSMEGNGSQQELLVLLILQLCVRQN